MAETAGIIIFFLWYIGIAINYAMENNNVKGDQQTEIRNQSDSPKQTKSPKQLSYHSQKSGASGTKSSRADNKSDIIDDISPIMRTVAAAKDHIITNASDTLIEVLHDISKFETHHESFGEIKSNNHSLHKENSREEERVPQVQDIMQDFIHEQEHEILSQEPKVTQHEPEIMPQELDITPNESAAEAILDGTFSDATSTASERNDDDD